MTKTLKIGDVITSKRFGYSHRSGHRLLVGCETLPVDVDPTRGKARYVVINTVLDGGSNGPCGMSGHDVYPHGEHIFAQRLNDDDSYSDSNEIIEFYMTGSFINLIPRRAVRVVGHMRRTFMWKE